MRKNFDRQYRMTVGQAGMEGFTVGETTLNNPEPLHISFSLQKSDLTTQNTGKIEIWNLSDAHIAELERPNCVVSLRAGYKTNMTLIFAGIVSFTKTEMDNADRKTTIEVVDNLIALRDSYVSISYNGVVNWRTIFDDVANQIGVVPVYSYNAEFVNVENGFSFIGLAKDILSKGCECCGLDWSIQNGILQIKKKGDAISQSVYLLAPDTGMIGMPEKVAITDKNDSTKNTTGWDVTYFMNGAININDMVSLQSKLITGFFYVSTLEITGDNVSGDWVCKARLSSLAQNEASSGNAEAGSQVTGQTEQTSVAKKNREKKEKEKEQTEYSSVAYGILF